MRAIGKLESEARARSFSDYLVVEGIGSEIEQNAEGSWTIWVHDEDQIVEAQNRIGRFVLDPESREFAPAVSTARKLKREEERQASRSRTRYVDVRTTWSSATVLRPSTLTLTLIGASVALTLLTDFGDNEELFQKLTIASHELGGGYIRWIKGLPDIMSGEVWRLFTPIFLHLDFVHLLFNMLWLKDLGSMIERRQGVWFLAIFILIVAALSNLGQYAMGGPRFGGMSGVVFALLGYLWIRGRFDRSSGYALQPWLVGMMLIWFVICLVGIIPGIANTAHGAGLLSGVIWGFVAAKHPWKR